MPFPPLTAPPIAPTRSMSNDEFIEAADAFVAWFVLHRSELVEWQEYLGVLAASLGVSDADAELQALASVTSAANKLFYFSGAGAGSLTDLTGVARTLLAQATQALMRTVGLGMSTDGSSLVAAADYAAMRTAMNLYTKAEVDSAVATAYAAAVAAAGLPPGSIQDFALTAAPAGWLKCNGAAVSRTTYASLFAAIGTTFGAGDGSTTFNLPEDRGEFRRGLDDGRGIDPGRALGTHQSDEIKAHTHSFPVSFDDTGNGTFADATTVSTASGTVTTSSTGGGETRPRNNAYLVCIKT